MTSKEWIGAKKVMDNKYWKPGENNNTLCLKGPKGENTGEPAVIEALGVVNQQTFKLDSVGGWQARYETDLKQQKASCHLLASLDHVIEAYNTQQIRGAKDIEKSKKTAGAAPGNLFFQDAGLRGRWSLWEVSTLC